MAQANTAPKRVSISKANAQMVIILAVASFVTIFCLVASKAVLSQNTYNARLIREKEKARDQLRDNLKAFDSLVSAYKEFDGASTNVIGGSRDGQGENDGSNSKIILNALPSSYDFPALTSSLEKILVNQSFKVSGITGVDDQLNQQTNIISPKPVPVPMPFSFSVSDATYDSVKQLITKLESSTRPIQMDSIVLTGDSSKMTLTVGAHTYYQPGKAVSITKKVVK
jgi:hypothetical protein